MKKLLVIATVVAGAYGASAQGIVNFNTSTAAAEKISVNSTPGGAATAVTTGAGNFYYELFYSTTATTATGAGTIPPATAVSSLTSLFVPGSTGWLDTTFTAESSASAGKVSGPTAASISALSGGESANFVVIGWSANIGTSISALEAFLANPQSTINNTPTYVGESSVVDNLGTGNGGTLATPTILAPSTIPGFILGEVAVPEPSTIALGVMGAASLLALRRKKA